MFGINAAKVLFGLAFSAAAALALFLSLAVLDVRGTSAATADAEMEVYKSPTCSCCSAWLEHAEANGIKSTVRNLPSSGLQGLKDQVGLKPSTARVTRP